MQSAVLCVELRADPIGTRTLLTNAADGEIRELFIIQDDEGPAAGRFSVAADLRAAVDAGQTGDPIMDLDAARSEAVGQILCTK